MFGAAYIALTGLLLIWGTEVYLQAPAAGVGLAFLVIALGQAAGAPIVGALSESTEPLVAFTASALVALTGAFNRRRVSYYSRAQRHRSPIALGDHAGT